MVSPTSNKPISDPGAIEVDDATDSEETVDLVYHPSPTKGCDNIGWRTDLYELQLWWPNPSWQDIIRAGNTLDCAWKQRVLLELFSDDT